LAFWKKSARKIYAVDRGGLTIGAATQSNRVEEKLGEVKFGISIKCSVLMKYNLHSKNFTRSFLLF